MERSEATRLPQGIIVLGFAVIALGLVWWVGGHVVDLFKSEIAHSNEIRFLPGKAYSISQNDWKVGKMPEDQWFEVTQSRFNPARHLFIDPADDTSFVNVYFPMCDKVFLITPANTDTLRLPVGPCTEFFKIRGHGRVAIRTNDHRD